MEDTIERPTWLTNDFLEKTLRTREGFEESGVVKSIVHSAVGKGENNTSILYRVEIKCKVDTKDDTTEDTRLIVKTLSNSAIQIKFLTEFKTFEKEFIITKKIIPSMIRIFESKIPDEKINPLSAYCFKSSIPFSLILEDLTTLDFQMADRHSRLDLKHSILALKGLAKFHALSVALNEQDPSILEDFKTEVMFVEKNREVMKTCTQRMLDAIANTVEKWKGYEKYGANLRAVVPVLIDRLMVEVIPKENSLNVLTHGDCWVNNMMFHYSPVSGAVDDVRFIDFQLSRYSSPALDLQYFLYTSPQESIRSQKTDYLIEVYHEELCNILRKVGQEDKLISLEDLKREFDEKAFFGFNTACTVLAVVLADPSEAFDMENMKEDGTGLDVKTVEKTYSGNRFKEVFQELLPHFESKGVI